MTTNGIVSPSLRLGTYRPFAIAASVGTPFAALVVPALAAVVAVLMAFAASKRPVLIGAASSGLLATLLAVSNASKGIDGDWAWYVLHYEALKYTPLSEYFGVRFGPVSAEPTEPLYYAVAQVLAVSSGANVAVLAIAVTFIIYGAMGGALVATMASLNCRAWDMVVGTVAGMLVGLTFTLTTQLLRQEIAASFIAVAIVASAYRKWPATIASLAAAVLTHNSAMIPAAGLVLAVVLRRGGRGATLRFLIGGLVFYALGLYYLTTVGNAAYTGQDNGSIGVTVIAFDLFILGVFAFLVRRRGLGSNPVASTVLFCFPAFYGFVLGVASQPLPLLRMYFFIEVLRALMIALIVACLMRGPLRLFVGLGVIVGAFGYLALRIQQSPFTYALSPLEVLLWSPLIDLLRGG